MPDMSAMYNVPSALMAAAAANAGQVQFDPQVLMASATAAAAAAGGTPATDSAATAEGHPATQQQQKRKGGGRRKVVAAAQLTEEEEEEEEEEAADDEDDEDWSWKNTKVCRRTLGQGAAAAYHGQWRSARHADRIPVGRRLPLTAHALPLPCPLYPACSPAAATALRGRSGSARKAGCCRST
jgi:hypothetical protein